MSSVGNSLLFHKTKLSIRSCLVKRMQQTHTNTPYKQR